MKKLLVSVFFLIGIFPAYAFEPGIIQKSPLDVLPDEIRLEILKFVTGDTPVEAIKGIKNFYLVSEKGRKSLQINQAILAYLIGKFTLNAKELQQIVKNLNQFEVFKNPAMIQWIEDQKTRLHEENLLRQAAFDGDIEKVKKLVEKKINVNARDKHRQTALTLAVSRPMDHTIPPQEIEKQNEILKILISSGADVNAQQVRGSTALNIAASDGKKLFVETLLKHNADPDIEDITGSSPLSRAAFGMSRADSKFYSKYMDIIQMLLEKKAKIKLYEPET